MMPPKLQDRIAILFIDCWGSKPMYQFLGFRPSKIKFLGFVLLKLVLLVIAVNGGDQVKRLPGYNGDLPFTLETGYVGVGESEEVQLFYYFVESQKDPLQDPLVLWIPGGPSCTALGSLFFASGPLAFDIREYDGGLPSLVLNPFAWTQVKAALIS
ncbi:hypothetical protein Q3G72_001118 [Acer saccharum]|nr:hypothetical protein Q3G72_001118 [Acer saccharum]